MGEVQIEEIATDVYCARSPISNCGVVALATVTVVIDALARPSWAGELFAFVAAKSADRPVLTVNTHYHWDHVGGNSATNGTIVSSAATRETLLRVGEQYLREGLKDEFSPAGLPAYLPQVALEAATVVDVETGITTLIESCPEPAHTSGDLTARVQGVGVTFLGDLLFSGLLPVVDASGSVHGWKRALDAQLDRPGAADEVFVGGHGPPGGAVEVRALRDYLGTVIRLCDESAGQGRPAQDTASDPAFEPYTGWGRQERHPALVAKVLTELSAAQAVDDRVGPGDGP